MQQQKQNLMGGTRNDGKMMPTDRAMDEIRQKLLTTKISMQKTQQSFGFNSTGSFMDQRRTMATSQKANRVPRTTFKVAHLYKKVPERSQSFCESLFWWSI